MRPIEALLGEHKYVPSDIVFLCLMYCGSFEYISCYGSNIEYNEETKTMTHTGGHYNSAYGHVKIYYDGRTNKYIWTLKIIKNFRFICIGIDASNKGYVDGDYTDSNDSIGFGGKRIYIQLDGKRERKKTGGNIFGINDGDTIVMELNIELSQIIFLKKHTDKKYSVNLKKDVFQNKVFYLAIYLPNINDSVQLLDFTHDWSF